MTHDVTLHGDKIATLNPLTEGAVPDFTLTDLKECPPISSCNGGSFPPYT